MRRNVIIGAVLAIGLVGCGSFRDLFSAHANVAAEAGGQELPAERLAQIMVGGGKSVRMTRETADFIANAWVDYTLLGQAVAQGKLPHDSASIAEAVWPELSELKGTHWHDSLMARRTSVSDAAVDSLYSKTDIRLLQHILFGVRPNTEAAQRAATRKKAEGTLAELRKGANFSGLAAQLSEDPGSKADSGYLPPGPKGRFVPAFDSAGWTLQPGQVSGLVETAFGYHILKRPDLADARPRMRRYLVASAGVRLDSMYMDSLAQSKKLEVVKDAPASIRAALESPDDARRSNKTLVRFNGGSLTVKDLMRWISALPPQYTSQLRQADDSMLSRFARLVSQNVLLLRQADSAGVTPTAEEWRGLRQRYESQVDSLKAEMGLTGDVTDSSVALPEREKVAALKVERYFDQLVAGKSRLRPLPSALASLLREHLDYSIHEAGVSRAFELASEERSNTDSAAAPGAMQRAPGPPPVPGARPSPRPAPQPAPRPAQPEKPR
jgi:hypothetical protein